MLPSPEAGEAACGLEGPGVAISPEDPEFVERGREKGLGICAAALRGKALSQLPECAGRHPALLSA
jgi:hypothetical protein